ncbi:unnamed protein product [Polarella glacialis]|uniref:Uncharacterized protein n=1 Tax=Polarella glacialis TaxID=89957 RepID=A0A813KLB1_POLGL|nr:unnamed protein product [Polarella glacialis]
MRWAARLARLPLAVAAATAALFGSAHAAGAEELLPEVHIPAAGLPLREAVVTQSSGGSLQTVLRLSAVRLVGPNISLITRVLNGSVPGPTISILPGDRLSIVLENQLGAPLGRDATNNYHHPNSSNLHVHGLHVNPNAPGDDVMGTIVRPGTSSRFEYKLIPDHSPGTYWAHPHHHGSQVMQAGAGAASALLVRDPPGFLSHQLEALQDHVLVLQNLPRAILQKAAKASGDKLFEVDEWELPQDLWLVNGAPMPVLTMKPLEWHRLRFIMAGVSSWLHMDFGDCQVALLAKDGIYINDFPRFIATITLPPGGRADVVLRCSGEGDQVVQSLAAHGNKDVFVGPLLTLRTLGPVVDAGVLLPWKPLSRPTYLQDLRGELTAPDCRCMTPLGLGGNTKWISGHLYEGPKQYLHQWPQDAVAERVISGVDKHTYHQHTWPFQLQDDPAGADPYFKAGDWHDSYQNIVDSQVTVRFSTVDYSGPEIVHCHILSHSDMGMIGVELVRGHGPDACACDLLGEAKPVALVGLPGGKPGHALMFAAASTFLAMLGIGAATMLQVYQTVSNAADYAELPDGQTSSRMPTEPVNAGLVSMI